MTRDPYTLFITLSNEVIQLPPNGILKTDGFRPPLKENYMSTTGEVTNILPAHTSIENFASQIKHSYPPT